jgi:rare lipoprotein A
MFLDFFQRREIRAVFLALLALLAAACGRARVEPPAYVEEGTASWYGPGFHGRTTSNREIYDMYDMTAAHQTLPFGTHVMVTNLRNGKSAVVRINDRGPFVKERIIDLSYAAAIYLEMVDSGTSPVRIEVIPRLSPDPRESRFSVQVGSFTERENAEAMLRKLKPDFPEVYLSDFQTRTALYYRVRIRARNRAHALELARRLRDRGIPVLLLEEW